MTQAQSRVPYLRKRSRNPVQAALWLWHHPMCRHCNLQLIQSPMAPSHGPPARVLSPPFFQAKSLLLPKPRGKREQPKATWSQSTPPKPTPHMAAMPGFKSQCQSSSAAPFPTPATISYTCQHSHILPALLGCRRKSGQAWPRGMEPVFSKLSRKHCNRGELPPSYILGGSRFHPPG